MARQVRTYWLVRRRYRRAADIVAVLGAATAVFLLVAPTVQVVHGALDTRTLLVAAVIVLASALVPRLAVRGLWRLQRTRLRERPS